MTLAARIQRRLSNEKGTLHGRGRRAVALIYPSEYSVGASSLGLQTIYRLINHLDDAAAERAFLPEDPHEPLLTYESQRPASDFPVMAFSVAYELELTGVFTCLARAGVPLLARDRDERHPWVIMGGPLTFSNPLPLAPFADLIVVGEAEPILAGLVDALFAARARGPTLEQLASQPHLFVPSLHGEAVPAPARCSVAALPAYSAFWTPGAALENMFLVEAERGCSRACTFCVMRKGEGPGMRIVDAARVLDCIPTDAPRVGLVGAAVSDHPQLTEIVEGIVDTGREVGLSSLRADKLTPALVELLVRGGYRTLTVASDAPSERLRTSLSKRIREQHLVRAAELASAAEMEQLKIYMMIGLPGETDEDLAELVRATLEQANAAGKTRVSLGVAPFVAKIGTPLNAAPFVGIREAQRRIRWLREKLAPRVKVRPTSARWAWVEYLLAQGNSDTGLAVMAAWQRGASFAAFKAALAPHEPGR